MLRALLLGLVLHLASVSDAAAHATLVASEPDDGAVLEDPPSEIVLRFSEPVMPIFVHVIGPDGQRVSAHDTVRPRDRELRLPLPEELAEGGYIVSYRVVSADSHPVGGSLVFAIGAGTGLAAPPPDDTAVREDFWRIAKILLRLAQNVALMVAAGGALFRLLILRAGDEVAPLESTILGGAAVAVLTGAIGVGVQGGLLAAAPASAFFDPDVWSLGASTTLGAAALVMIGGLALMALATVMSARPAARLVAALGALAATTSLALTGHSAAASSLGQVALAFHAATVAFWLGALWPLHTIVRTRSPVDAAALVRRFSAIAVPAVAMLVAAGVGTALTRIDNLEALVGSDYGRILLLKVAVVALLLAIAAINRQRVTPTLSAGLDESAVALGRNIRLELALAGTILLITAVLAHTAPPQRPVGQANHVHEAARGYAVVTKSRGRTLLLEVTPARVGHNALILRLSDADGRPLAPIETSVALSLQAASIEPLVRTPARKGEGLYELTHIDLPIPGRWHVRVDALISDFEKVIFTTEVQVR